MKHSDIQKLLPMVYQRSLQEGAPLDALLDAMVSMFTPAETVLENIATYFSPYTAPDAFVRYLAKWVDLDRYLGTTTERQHVTQPLPVVIEPGRLRELVAKAARLSQWRGTAKGLKLFLETATGVGGFQIDESVSDKDGVVRVFHIRIRAPQVAAQFQQLVTRIVNGEKPAYVTYDIEFDKN